MDSYAEFFYEYEKKNGLSDENIANIIGISRTTVSKWRSGTHIPGDYAKRAWERYLERSNQFSWLQVFQSIKTKTTDSLIEKEKWFQEQAQKNRKILPNLLYDDHDVSMLTRYYPDEEYLNFLYGLELYQNPGSALDMVLGPMTNLEAIQYLQMFKEQMNKLSQYGISKEFFINNARSFSHLPTQLSDIPVFIRSQIFSARAKVCFSHSKRFSYITMVQVMKSLESNQQLTYQVKDMEQEQAKTSLYYQMETNTTLSQKDAEKCFQMDFVYERNSANLILQLSEDSKSFLDLLMKGEKYEYNQ